MREADALRREMANAPAPHEPEAAYRERLAWFGALRDRYNRQRYLWANLSVVTFLGGLVALLVAAFAGNLMWALGGVLALLLFVVAFIRQTLLDETHRRYVALCDLSEEGLARLRRDWSHMTLRAAPDQPAAPADAATADAATAADLDLLGHASLQHLLHTVTTPAGQRELTRWLLTPATPATIRARQVAVRELSTRPDLRDELSVFGKLSNMSPAQYQRFITWCGAPPQALTPAWLNAWSLIAPVAL
ncbi:MAG TPA: hypothetical protein VF725_14695, partial [Ktedonobacterales bacterium]